MLMWCVVYEYTCVRTRQRYSVYVRVYVLSAFCEEWVVVMERVGACYSRQIKRSNGKKRLH